MAITVTVDATVPVGASATLICKENVSGTWEYEATSLSDGNNSYSLTTLPGNQGDEHEIYVEATPGSAVEIHSIETVGFISITETGVFAEATASPFVTELGRTTLNTTEITTTASPFVTDLARTTLNASITDATVTMGDPDEHALLFDGQLGDYVDVGGTVELNPGESLTLWIESNNIGSPDSLQHPTILAASDNVFDNHVTFRDAEFTNAFNTGDVTTQLVFDPSSGSGGTTSNFTFTTGVPHALALVWKSDGTMEAYLDGSSIGTVSLSNTDHFDIGILGGGYGSGTNNAHLDGRLNDVRHHSTELTPTQVSDHASGNELDTSGEFYYELNEGTGTTATDSSGNNNDGTINGTAWTAWPKLQEFARATEANLIVSSDATVFTDDFARATETDLLTNAAALPTSPVAVYTRAFESGLFTNASALTTIIKIPPIPRMGLDVTESTAELHHGTEDWDT